jgi:hypothetical protein
MQIRKAKRFGSHEVPKGPYKGALHVATERYRRFHGELEYFSNYLDTRLLPREPEEATMCRILMNLQNLLEHEAELAVTANAHRIRWFRTLPRVCARVRAAGNAEIRLSALVNIAPL